MEHFELATLSQQDETFDSKDVGCSATTAVLCIIVGCLAFCELLQRLIKLSNIKNLAVTELPEIRRDFTIQELRQYDGTQPDGRILLAVDGTVYDVTKVKHVFGPGGDYAKYAGRDVSNHFDKICVIADLKGMESSSPYDWELPFVQKYYRVGNLSSDNDKGDEQMDTIEDTIGGSNAPLCKRQSLFMSEDGNVA